MESTFNGLTMPVFTAFGWAGEEAAIKYAYTNLQLFVQAIHQAFPREMQSYFPHYGVDKESQCAYLARNESVESDLYVTFHTRPMAFRIDVNLTDRAVLLSGFQRLAQDTAQFYRGLIRLDPEWSVRFQQMEYDADNQTATHYKDVFKGPVGELTQEKTDEVVMRAEYLNGEKDRWLAPFYMSRSYPSEFVASMGVQVVSEMVKELDSLRTVLFALSKPADRVMPKPTKKPKKSVVTAAVVEAESADTAAADQKERFSYIATLKPLHLRKGFINMTPNEWPFFAVNARTTTRPVTVFFENQSDPEGNVWRLSPHDQARLMLGPKGKRWLREHFGADEKINVIATKHLDDTIDIALEPVE